jgi:transposase
VKTDRRDAQKLAVLHRSGDLTRVWVPDPVHEAMRDLVRARLDAVMALMRARQQLLAFLLRHGRTYEKGANSTRSRARIPRQGGRGFHAKVGTDSTGSWAPSDLRG